MESRKDKMLAFVKKLYDILVDYTDQFWGIVIERLDSFSAANAKLTQEEIEAWAEANPPKFSAGDRVIAVNSRGLIAPELTGLFGTVLRDAGYISEFGERGYLVRMQGAIWEYSRAPEELDRSIFAMLESELVRPLEGVGL